MLETSVRVLLFVGELFVVWQDTPPQRQNKKKQTLLKIIRSTPKILTKYRNAYEGVQTHFIVLYYLREYGLISFEKELVSLIVLYRGEFRSSPRKPHLLRRSQQQTF